MQGLLGNAVPLNNSDDRDGSVASEVRKGSPTDEESGPAAVGEHHLVLLGGVHDDLELQG